MQAEFSNSRGNGFIISPPPDSGFTKVQYSPPIDISHSLHRFKSVSRTALNTYVLHSILSSKKFFSRLLSLAVSICCIASFFSFFSFGTGVYLDGKLIASAECISDFNSALLMANNETQKIGIKDNLIYTTAPVFSLKTKLSTKDELRDKLLISGGHFVSGCSVYSGDTLLFCAASTALAQEAVKKYIASYSKGTDTSLSTELTYKNGVFPKSELSGVEECISLLTQSSAVNVISVVNTTSSKVLPFSTHTQNDESLYIGDTLTITEGINGSAQIKSETVYENGNETLTRTLSEEVIAEPVTKVIKVGTKFKDVLKSGLVYPLKGTLSSPFGGRWGRMHEGIDIAVSEGTPVKSAECGIVSYVSEDAGGYGKFIRIDHGHGVETAYAHLSEIKVSLGQAVKAGSTIALSGNTGRSTGPHLHFEITQNGTPVDPLIYLK